VAIGETELEMVERHVREAERHVLRQRQIIEQLLEGHHSTALAEQLLTEFEQTLHDHRAHLARLTGRPASHSD
jgi:FixJ family two-component response regulator